MKKKLTKFDYYDSVKFLKDVEPERYSLIKKIHRMKANKCDWGDHKTFLPNPSREFLESKNGHYYTLQFGYDRIVLKEQHNNKKYIIDPIIEIGKNEINDNPLISMSKTAINDNLIIPSRVFKVYELGNKNYKFFMIGPLELLYSYFKIKIKTLDLSTQEESQVKSLLENTNHSANSIIQTCMENGIDEPNEESLFYLKLLLSN